MRKNLLLIIGFALMMGGCGTEVKLIGKVNIISTRNIDSNGEYVLLRNYMGGSKKEINTTRARDIESAIDQTVKNTPGGEFLKNVKIYRVDGMYYAIEGDVWGIAENNNFRGWKVGDRVQYTKNATINYGTITELTNAEQCTISDENGKLKKIEYSILKKAE